MVNTNDLVIKELRQIDVGNKKFPIQAAFIKSMNDNGTRYIDIYALTENIDTKEEQKIRIRIRGVSFEFEKVVDKE